jgi:segregation and condensation protein A
VGDAKIQRARVNKHHWWTREQLLRAIEMSRMLKMLQPARYLDSPRCSRAHADVAHLIVTFLALLELSRERLNRRMYRRPRVRDHPRPAARRAAVRAGRPHRMTRLEKTLSD